MALIDDLDAAPADISELRLIMSRHKQPADEWPENRAEVRQLASCARANRPEKAALLLIAALEDLRRYFASADGDDDGGWHRSQAKHWERWAYCRELRSVLVDSDRQASWRAGVLSAVAALWGDSGSNLEGWIDATDFDPLAPSDATYLRKGTFAASDEAWFAPEESLALRVLEAKKLNAKAVRNAIERQIGRRVKGDADDLMSRLYVIRRAAERLADRENDPHATTGAGLMALMGLAHARSDPSLAPSEEREEVAIEQTAALEIVLVQAVHRGGRELWRLIRETASQEKPEVGARVRQLLGEGTPEEVAEDFARLTAQRDAAGDEQTRQELDSELVFHFPNHLLDDEYLAICRRLGYTRREVDRLLSRGRIDEAYSIAHAKVVGETEGSSLPSSLRDLALSFLTASRADLAESLLRPYAKRDPSFAELFARCLSAQGSHEARAAYLSWFCQRPTPQTYGAIAEAVAGDEWPRLREEIHTHLETRNLNTTLIDIAVEHKDAAAIDKLLPRLRDAEFEHAKARVRPLLSRLSPETVRLLDTGSALWQRKSRPCRPSQQPPPPAQVSHPKFGIGRVLRVEGSGDDRKYVIAFDGHGEKTLLARFVEAV